MTTLVIVFVALSALAFLGTILFVVVNRKREPAVDPKAGSSVASNATVAAPTLNLVASAQSDACYAVQAELHQRIVKGQAELMLSHILASGGSKPPGSGVAPPNSS